jgi:hypothetical protein
MHMSQQRDECLLHCRAPPAFIGEGRWLHQVASKCVQSDNIGVVEWGGGVVIAGGSSWR